MSSEEILPSPLTSSRRSELGLVRVAVACLTLGLALYTVVQVLTRCGHPAVPLDDAFIHFQYARRIAEGHGLSYVDGEPFSSGATSLLWPAALAIFHALGLRDLAIVWAAWAMGFAALGALAIETYRIARPLTGPGEASGAALMVLAFGGHVWCAASGMEVVPLAWLLAYAVRSCAEWREAPPAARSPAARRRLCAVALAAPLMRPEGMLASAAVSATLAFFPAAGRLVPAEQAGGAHEPRRREALAWMAWASARRHAFVAALGPLLLPTINWAATGHATSSTTVVKWLPGNPYYGQGSTLLIAVGQNVRLLFETLLDGREWSALFVPAGARPFALAALVAIPALGFARGRSFRSALVLAMALGMLLPCTYLTFLWNRLRYLWPFAFAWMVGLACAARCVADVLAALTPRLRFVGPAVSWLIAVVLASHLGWTTADVVESASAIDRQQVALARWAAAALPSDARIGVNDTGAIAYLGGHPTFDVVGLTTPGEAKYWVAGAGARFEHYERLFRQGGAERFPTHFIVYRNWLGCDAVLGEALTEATVLDQTILGGTTMTAFTARRDLLESGALPVAMPSPTMIDELDVADLESEAAHRYLLGPTRETASLAVVYELANRSVADGVRAERTFERFQLVTSAGGVVVSRLAADVPVEVELWRNDAPLGRATLTPSRWTETSWQLDGAAGGTAVFTLRSRDGLPFAAAHYWSFSPSSADGSPGGSAHPETH